MLGCFFISADHTSTATFIANVNRGSICFFVFYRWAFSAVHTRFLSHSIATTHDKQNKNQTQWNSAKRFPHLLHPPYSFAPHSVQNAESLSTVAPQLGQTLAIGSAGVSVGSNSSCTDGSVSTGVPQLVQNFIPGWTTAPQFLQGTPIAGTGVVCFGMGAPQELQNAEPAATSAPHFSQRWTPLISWT